MALVIDASDLVSRRRLTVDSSGVEMQEGSIGGRRRFQFAQIDCLLYSPAGLLSFQVGDEVFKIQTKKNDARHKEVIDALVAALRSSAT